MWYLQPQLPLPRLPPLPLRPRLPSLRPRHLFSMISSLTHLLGADSRSLTRGKAARRCAPPIPIARRVNFAGACTPTIAAASRSDCTRTRYSRPWSAAAEYRRKWRAPSAGSRAVGNAASLESSASQSIRTIAIHHTRRWDVQPPKQHPLQPPPLEQVYLQTAPQKHQPNRHQTSQQTSQRSHQLQPRSIRLRRHSSPRHLQFRVLQQALRLKP